MYIESSRSSKIFFSIILILCMWSVFLWTTVLPSLTQLEFFSIYPRTLGGLKGIFFSTFFHLNISHIGSNTFPLLIFLSILVIFHEESFYSTIIVILLLGNFFTWVFGSSNYHLGASGLVYGLFSFNVTYGILKRNFISASISVLIFIIFIISFLSGLYPKNPSVSYSSHWSGFLVGINWAFFQLRKIKNLPTLVRVKGI